jgi:hypothetical protein
LVVVDGSALLSSDGVIERLVKLLGQAAAASAAAAAAAGEFHYGSTGRACQMLNLNHKS